MEFVGALCDYPVCCGEGVQLGLGLHRILGGVFLKQLWLVPRHV